MCVILWNTLFDIVAICVIISLFFPSQSWNIYRVNLHYILIISIQQKAADTCVLAAFCFNERWFTSR